jgi:hypothetical protein
MVGEIRGWEELARTYSLVPFDRDRVMSFLRVVYNWPFLMDKFIVSTALSLGLGTMAAAWYGAVRYLRDGASTGLLLMAVALVGTLLLHPAMGLMLLGGFLGGMMLSYAFRDRVRDFSRRRVMTIVLAALVSLLVAAPYLYTITHQKESEYLLPLGLYLPKTLGVLVTCALVGVLAASQLRRIVRDGAMASLFFVMGTLVVFLVANVIKLPGASEVDKPPFVVFYPLAVIASWTLADRFTRRHASTAYRGKVIAFAALLLVPVNAFALLGFYNTPKGEVVTLAESSVSHWVRRETPRDAVFIDSRDRVFLLITGPRRYYYGRETYADQWGYSKTVMAQRRHLRDNLYADEPFFRSTLLELGNMKWQPYIIVRIGEDGLSGPARFDRFPNLFEKVYESGPIVVFKVNRTSCLEMAEHLGI